MKNLKISSLHDDLLTPKATEHLGEYRDYPERFDPKDKSVLTRLEQFGVDLQVAQEAYGKDIREFTWSEYVKLVGEAIKSRYDVIVGSVFDQYALPSNENPENAVRWEKMLAQITRYQEMTDGCSLNLIKRKSDFGDESNLVLGLEAGANLIHSMADLKKLVAHNVKLFGFQYGKDTPLADTNGLTTFGKEAARYLLDNNLVIDLAHSNLKTRSDLIAMARDLDRGRQISYTHGCLEEDIIESWQGRVGERLLKKEEATEIIKMGGIIGLGVTKPFFANTRKVAERIDSIIQGENGIDSIAIGTDFGGVPPAWMSEIKSPEDFKILADILSEDFGMDDRTITKVIRTNVRNWLQQALD